MERKIIIGWFVFLSVWWLVLYLTSSVDGLDNLIFGATYGTTMALAGSYFGFWAAKLWGGWKSILGKAFIMLSLGLLAQTFGQVVFSFYNLFLGIQIPYPSIADVGYFGGIPLYIMGMLYFGRAAGVKMGLKSFTGQIQAVFIPFTMLVFSYIVFLNTYVFDWLDPVKIILDFGYPLGQAIYVSLAILVYSLSRKLLGGVMHKPILWIVGGFLMQYIADFNFLTQSLNETWYNGGYGDYLYLVAYFLMTLGLIQGLYAAKQIKSGK